MDLRVNKHTNLAENREFTSIISKMTSQKLELAIAKNDKKTLSKFARSDLIPENMKDNFLEAVNRQRGIRGMLVRAVNRTNSMFQNLAKRIDRFFDKINDRVANQKLDKYLQEYQFREFNKLAPYGSTSLDMQKNLDPAILNFAQNYVKNHNLSFLRENSVSDMYKEEQYLRRAVAKGFNAHDAKIALYQQFEKTTKKELEDDIYVIGTSYMNSIEKLQLQIESYEKTIAAKNETLEDFKILSRDMNGMQKIDILLKNKEYQKMDNTQKQAIENKHIFNQEPIFERLAETQKEFKTILERNATVNFTDKTVKNGISTIENYDFERWLKEEKNREIKPIKKRRRESKQNKHSDFIKSLQEKYKKVDFIISRIEKANNYQTGKLYDKIDELPDKREDIEQVFVGIENSAKINKNFAIKLVEGIFNSIDKIKESEGAVKFFEVVKQMSDKIQNRNNEKMQEEERER